jgi:DHA2 family multidrug resistance protein
MYQEVIRQATMLAFNDAFWVMAWLTACLIPLTFLLKRPKKGEGVMVV